MDVEHEHDNGSPSDNDMDADAGKSNISKLFDDASEESNMNRRNDQSRVGLRRSGRRRTLSAKYSEHLKMQNLLKHHQRLRLSSSSEEGGNSSGGSSYRDSEDEARGKENRAPNANTIASVNVKKKAGLNVQANKKGIDQEHLVSIGINKSGSPKKVTGKRTREQEESTPMPSKSHCDDDDENDCSIDIEHGMTTNNLSPTSSISSASHSHDEEERDSKCHKGGPDPQTLSRNKKSKRVEGRNSDDGSSSVAMSSLSDDGSSSTHRHGTGLRQKNNWGNENPGVGKQENAEMRSSGKIEGKSDIALTLPSSQNTSTTDRSVISSLCKDVTKKAKLQRSSSSTSSSSSSSWSLLSDASCLSSISESSTSDTSKGSKEVEFHTPKKSDRGGGGGGGLKKKKQQRKQKRKQKLNFTPRRSARLSAIMNKSNTGKAGGTMTTTPHQNEVTDNTIAGDKDIPIDKVVGIETEGLALEAQTKDALELKNMVQEDIEKDSIIEHSTQPIESKIVSLAEINASDSVSNFDMNPITVATRVSEKPLHNSVSCGEETRPQFPLPSNETGDCNNEMTSDLNNLIVVRKCSLAGEIENVTENTMASTNKLTSADTEETSEQETVPKNQHLEGSIIDFDDRRTSNTEKNQVLVPNPAVTTKPKRRRRSSLGLHVGGMVTLKDIEAFRKDAVEKKKDRTSRRRSLNVSAPNTHDENTSTNVAKECISSKNDSQIVNCDPMYSHQLEGEAIEDAEAEMKEEMTASNSTDDSPMGRVESPLEATSAEIKSEMGGAQPESFLRQTTSRSIENSSMDGAECPLEETPNEIESEMEHAKAESLIRENASSSTDDPSMHGAGFPLLKVTSDEIKSEMQLLFRRLDVHKKPSMSARLFACVALQMKARECDKDTLQFLLPLLQGLVQTEMASLNNLKNERSRRHKKVQFCSYNYSSTITPVDTIIGSNDIIESCIDTLCKVWGEINALGKRKDVLDSLGLFKSILFQLEEEGENVIYTECAESMPCPWPVRRFVRASKCYRQEFEYIKDYVAGEDCLGAPSLIRKSLGDFIGRAIRFHLRRLFNPVPCCLSSDSTDPADLPDYSKTRSRIHEMIEMRDSEDDDSRDTATADGSISSVIGIALQRIIEFRCLNDELNSRDVERKHGRFSISFCRRPASLRGLQERGCVIRLNEDNVKEIVLDIEESHVILAGIRATRFMHDLLSWPGISEAIEEVGGWNKIESFAATFAQFKLGNEMPQEYHFTLLQNIEEFRKEIQRDLGDLENIEQTCEDCLRQIWKRFRCGTRNKELVNFNPCIKLFQKLLKSGKETQFPYIAEATEWE